MSLLRFLGLLFILVSIFAGTITVVALVILTIRFWPLTLALLLTLAIFQLASTRILRPQGGNPP
ncbi:hypothetical protein F1C79_10535 [Pseudomonas denitrificans (nom. rej.)]|uniref:Uncharacterized protein n=1 Tax=Pseudomonas denitrificans TaxID=43306 RepID=A0A9X7MZ26_PSEDE|nr:hypothetical protein F1C79_10535 [Pseudomonas denitrificans (nom. rej.)]